MSAEAKSRPTGVRYDDDGIYFVNGCGCEVRLELVGIIMFWRSSKVCDVHRLDSLPER